MAIADFDKCVLLLPMSGANNGTVFTDYCKSINYIYNAGTITSTAQFHHYDSSGYFNGSAYLEPYNLVNLGSSDLTIEFWIRSTQGTQFATAVAKNPVSFTTGCWTILLNNTASSGFVTMYVGDFSTGSPLMTSSTTSVIDGSWHHVAITRNGSAWNIWIDGVSRASATWSGTISDRIAFPRIGMDGFYGRYFNGYMQDVLITLGTAKYTTSFTPDNALLKTISGTVKDDTNSNAIRTVTAVPRFNASRTFHTTSAADGTYSITVPDVEHTVIVLDDDAGTLYNDIIMRVLPG